MGNKLSHSSMERLLACQENYRLHYIEKMRPTTTGSPLIFGSAVDVGLTALISKVENPEGVFETAFTNAKINSEEVYIPTSTQVLYSTADFDADLLDENDYTKIENHFKNTKFEHRDYLQVYKELVVKKKTTRFNGFDEDEKIFYNLLNWLSLRQKGLLMIKAYRKKILPKILKVHSMQEAVILENGDGDSVIGAVDLVADFEGYDVPIVLDNKTSGRSYELNRVVTSPQLSLYIHMLEEKYKTRMAGYIVLKKSINKNRKKICKSCGYNGSSTRHATCNNIIDDKRCNGEWNETIRPECDVQIIIDEMPETTEQNTIENADSINEIIKAGVFEKNLNACNNWYGSKCVYYNLCHNNDSTGLICTKKEKKDG